MREKKRDIWVVAGMLALLALTARTKTGQFCYGVPFHGRIVYYAVFTALYICLALYLFECGEEYLKQYGIYTAIRYRKRSRMFGEMSVILLRKVLLFDVMKFAGGWGVLNLTGGAELPYMENAVKLLYFYIVSLMVDVLLAMLQIILEMLLDARWALTAMGGYYIISLVTADVLHDAGLDVWMLLFAPNLGMSRRMEALDMPDGILVLILAVICSGLWLAGQQILKRKDIL